MKIIEIPGNLKADFFLSPCFFPEQQELFCQLLQIDHLKEPDRLTYCVNLNRMSTLYAKPEDLLNRITETRLFVPNERIAQQVHEKYGSTVFMPFPTVDYQELYKLEINKLLKRLFMDIQQR